MTKTLSINFIRPETADLKTAWKTPNKQILTQF